MLKGSSKMEFLVPIGDDLTFVANPTNKQRTMSSKRKWSGVRVCLAALASFNAAAIGLLMTVAPSQAQTPGFACPKAGTVAQYELGKVQYLGTSPDDSYDCLRVDPWGKTGGRLFNLYFVEKAEYPAVRSAMISLFSKHSQSVSFLFTASSNRNQYRATWTFLRTELLVLGDRKIETDVYEDHQQGLHSNNFDGKWVMWLDPRTGIWIKNDFSITSGTATGLGGQLGKLVSIVDP
jgi:hypothetical protein